MRRNILLIILVIVGTTFGNQGVFAQNPEGLENILILENYSAEADCFQIALDNLGWVYTNSYNGLSFPEDDNDFEIAIDEDGNGVYDGDWDLIIFNYDNATSINILNALNGYVQSGGYLIMDYLLTMNFSSHPLWTSMGFSTIPGPPLTNPFNFVATDNEHLLFNSPNSVVSNFNFSNSSYIFYGNAMTASATSTQIAYIEGNTNGAVIILNEQENTIYNSLQAMSYQQDDDNDGKLDMVELAENQIAFFAPLTASVIPNADCGTGTIILSSNKLGIQTFYLRDEEGNAISEWTGNASSYQFDGLADGTYRGQVEKDGVLSSLTDPVNLINFINTNIISQPESYSANVGDDVMFEVIAEGSNLNYQWRFEDVDIVGAESSTYLITDVQVSDMGNYDVLVWGVCGSQESEIATLDVTSAINEPKIDEVLIFPNPSSGILNISTKNKSKLEIIDITGRIINTENITGKKVIKINKSGIYFFKLSNSEEIIIRKVVVK